MLQRSALREGSLDAARESARTAGVLLKHLGARGRKCVPRPAKSRPAGVRPVDNVAIDQPPERARNVVELGYTPQPALPLRRVSFGSPAAIVTSTSLIVGLHTATIHRSAIAGSLLIFALADNLTDSLGVHIYQESERLNTREAFRTTVANFLARLLLSLSFVAIVLIAPSPAVVYLSIVWGLSLLSGLSYLLARARGVSALAEIFKHCAVALAVVALSKFIGVAIRAWLGQG